MEKEKLILGFAGEMGAGKGAAANIVKESFPGTPVFLFSDVLRELYEWIEVQTKKSAMGLLFSIETKHLQNLSTELRRLFGQDILGRAILERIRSVESPSPIIIIDGIRRLSDIATIMENPRFCLIYIDAEPEVRWERHRARNEKYGDAKLSFDEFCVLGEDEAEKDIRMLKTVAAVNIQNNSSILDLADSLLPQIRARL